MQLKIVNSNSSGNCYILENEMESLIIECGVRFDRIQRALNFKLRNVVGALLSHEHGDHSKGVHELQSKGIDVYASLGTLKALKIEHNHRSFSMVAGKSTVIGGFEVIPFEVNHDAAEPFGFLIRHKECGITLFLTDTKYSKYRFGGLNNVIVEANYCEGIIAEKLLDKRFLKDRVIDSHLSIQTCIELLKANDLSQVNNIVLIHLSDSNSDEARFKKNVAEVTGKTVHVATAGMCIDFNKTPF